MRPWVIHKRRLYPIRSERWPQRIPAIVPEMVKMEKIHQKLIDSTILQLLNQKEKLIIEGIQVYLYKDINQLKNHSVIVTGTSLLKSVIRTYRRNKTEDWNNLDTMMNNYYNLFITKIKTKIKTFIKHVNSWK